MGAASENYGGHTYAQDSDLHAVSFLFVGKTPKPKPQAPKKSQASSSKPRCGGCPLELEIWSFFGIWVLGFGVFIRCSACSMFVLFISQRLHRIDLRGASGGQPTRQERDGHEQQ